MAHKPHEFTLAGLTTTSRSDRYDLLIVGCGPAGLSAADRASEKGLRVALVDPKPLNVWRNNYGVWVDEFEALGLGDCFSNVWPKARVVLDDDDPNGIQLDRAYGQVDRIKLKVRPEWAFPNQAARRLQPRS
jgi:lycopene cyclase-like protein|tara:strand:- start:3950 stop:4345 length:396 start_codon:yes stop_codon:yes gene_type:complete